MPGSARAARRATRARPARRAANRRGAHARLAPERPGGAGRDAPDGRAAHRALPLDPYLLDALRARPDLARRGGGVGARRYPDPVAAGSKLLTGALGGG